MDPTIEGAPYVRRARDEISKYIHDLYEENENLIRLVGFQREQMKVAERELSEARELLHNHEDLRGSLATVAEDKERLRSKVRLLEREIERHRAEREMLERQLYRIEVERNEFSSRYVEVEAQNNNLVNLYVAGYQLHSTLDRERVIEIIKEIVINAIGSEQLGLFELEPAGNALKLIGSFGIDDSKYGKVGLDSGLIGQAFASGKIFCAQDPDGNLHPNPEGLTACIPLRVEEKSIGALAIFSLLQQKAAYQPVDFELFQLLGAHAAMALYATGPRN